MTKYPWITLDASFDQNADRHQKNGDRYLAEGKPDYAAGSYRKAMRNRARAADIRELCTNPTRRMARMIAMGAN